MIDSYSFIVGILFAMILDILFSVANYFVEKSFALRKKRKDDVLNKKDIKSDGNKPDGSM